MRRKQLYAIILAGALATGSAPAAVFAAEGDVAAMTETSEEAPVEDNNASEETPAQDTTATEAPAQDDTAPAQDTATATEVPAQDAAATEAPAEQAQAAEETPAAETTEAPEAGATPAEGETTEPTAISITLKATEEGEQDQVRYFDSIQHAINAAPDYNAETAKDVTVIEVSGELALDATVSIPANKKVCIRAKDAATIKRASADFTDDMFQVSGENAELQFDVKEGAEGASLTISGAVDENGTQTVTGTIVNVSSGGVFGIYTGVTLTGNNSSAADGGAITNKGGMLLFAGGSVTGNIGAKGGIYSNTAVCIQGDAKVTDNKNVQGATANLYVELADETDVAIKVTGLMADTASVGYTDATPATDKKVITIGKDAANQLLISTDDFKTAVSKFTYDDSAKYKFAELAEGADVLTLVEVNKPEESTFKLVQVGQVVASDWKDYSTVTVRFNTTEKCKYYALYKNANATIENTFDENRSSYRTVDKVGDVSLTANNVPDGDKAIVIYAKSIETGAIQTCKIVLQNRPKKAAVAFKLSQETKDSWYKNNHNTLKEIKFKVTHDCKYYYEVVKAGTKASSLKYSSSKAKMTAKANETKSIKDVEIKDGDYALAILARSTTDGTEQKMVVEFKNRPKKATTREAKKYSVTDNTVSGLENALKFFPSKKYEFSVTEAGMDNISPIAGDERYEFLYWSTNSSGEKPQTKTAIMSLNGISDANNYNMYLFFQKYRFNGENWVKVGSPESITTRFSSAGYTDEELKAYLEEAKEEGTVIPGYENYTGGGTDAELTATAAASEKDAGSKSKSAVSTADESPIGSMSALAALSLLAGGYIIVRKRKKEEL